VYFPNGVVCFIRERPKGVKNLLQTRPPPLRNLLYRISPANFTDVSPDFFIFTPPVSQERYRPIVQFAVIRTETGDAGEAMVPIKVLKGLRLALDHAIGASFESSDTDTPGSSEQELMMSSAPKSSSDWGNPLNWVNLIIK
jgi:hypothetical protein